MPDITTCYPSTAALLAEKNLLASLDQQFTKEELEAYLPRFLEEGRLEDGNLYVFPFAKSTEVLFLTQTLFDEFSEATGVTEQDLSTFEGIAQAAMTYYQWTDGLTPDVPEDGKQFYTADSLFNLAQVGMEQMGTSLWDGESLSLDGPAFQRIWNVIFEPAVRGGYAIYDGYSSDLSKTGDILSSTGSTAGILFYGEEITYPDNTREQVEYSVLPFPTFEGGNKIAIQRGSGLVVAKSTPAKEEAAAIFLKWFTAPQQNMRFISSTGYLPVTDEAFLHHMEQEIEKNENVNIQKLLRTAIAVHDEYDFYTPPAFHEFNSISNGFEETFMSQLKKARAKYLSNRTTMDSNAAYQDAAAGALEAFLSTQKP